jgi:hypothetical protein
VYVPKRLFLAAVYRGGLGGALLGTISGGVILAATILTFRGSAYGDTQGLYALVAAAVIGALAGLLVGAMNGLVITLLVYFWARPGQRGHRPKASSCRGNRDDVG